MSQLDNKIENIEPNRKKRIEDYRNVIKNDQFIHKTVEKRILENYYKNDDIGHVAFVTNSHLNSRWPISSSIDDHIMKKYNFNDLDTETRCNAITKELNKRSRKVHFYCDTLAEGEGFQLRGINKL